MVRIDSETLTIHDLNCPSKQQTNVKSQHYCTTTVLLRIQFVMLHMAIF